MQANVSTRLDGDESDEKTLSDYVDLGGIDKLQLEDDSEEGDR